MANPKLATVEFLDLTYTLRRSDLQLISDALDIVSPDSSEVGSRAQYLASMFLTLAERRSK